MLTAVELNDARKINKIQDSCILVKNFHMIPTRDERRHIALKISKCISDKKTIWIIIQQGFKKIPKGLNIKRITLNRSCWEKMKTKGQILESIKDSVFTKDRKYTEKHIDNIFNLRSLNASEILFIFAVIDISQYFKINSKFKIPIKTLINLYQIFIRNKQTEMQSKSTIINVFNMLRMTMKIKIKITNLNVIFEEKLIYTLSSKEIAFCGLLIFWMWCGGCEHSGSIRS